MPAPGYSCFAITPPGVERLTAGELPGLGITPGAEEPGGIAFEATAAQLYRANLELRTASRIVVRIAEFPARAFYELERKSRRIPWSDIVTPGTPVRFRVSSRKSRLYHLDGIAERLHQSVNGEPLAKFGGGRSTLNGTSRDDEDPDDHGIPVPQQLFLVRVVRDVVTISADSSGALLHRRGYRLATGKAPVRESLAAALLLGAGYREGMPLVDPFCGSGTLPIEAALIARRIAPGLGRSFALERWPSFDARLGEALRAEAAARVLPRSAGPIAGTDRDAGAIEAARANAARAGVGEDVDFRVSAVSAVEPGAEPGLLATNPPYGMRVGDRGDLRDLYARLGSLLRERWSGWSVAMLSADQALLSATGLSFAVRWESTNGGIPIRMVMRD